MMIRTGGELGRLMREVTPYFQPILSLQTQQIVAYEALGRRIVGGSVQSLGPFFHDPAVSDDDHMTVDRVLRDMAMARLMEKGEGAQLFINLKPSWIYRKYKETGELPTLRLIEKNGLNPSRIVIEITEEEFTGRLDQLSAIINIYRQQGCRIAIDDIGSGYSNYDRIASIKPHILKIDLKLLKKSAVDEGYKAVLNSFSILASQMGASLLVEGVETKHDLYQAMKAGARYVQGFLFSEARAEFQEAGAFQRMLAEEIARYTEKELARYRKLFAIKNNLNELVPGDANIQNAADADLLIEGLKGSIADNVVRVYICREDGCQVSSNYIRSGDGMWDKDVSFQGANWIWRPYFIPNMLQMKSQGQGILSQVYTDLDSAHSMQTFACQVGEQHYLFLDLTV
ncbi:EAL domain-containing protein [Paenibacillus allorhizosphaerae]|uniref:EAL-domain containing protein YkuI n=1 Tax=Paenibacillus allorhizosphaerae TaxID=2849866 RepID=A0ABM8VPV6_9BACL|nr:EAL domain-containing protein [Paenibacillus allorhizosphaerae]CAG7653096.1 putative EAL-domain containing protein YkuI [Paenibacillus allorhizosphaerae]